MAKYKKKTLVEAVQTINKDGYAAWDETQTAPGWLTSAVMSGQIFKCRQSSRMKIMLKEGIVDLMPGAWLVRGHNGAIWPLDAKSFEESYDKVED
jgi:hypothetical protein